ncbi:arsenate reductase (glutaredoxin) [Aureispira anguillae]|uniref:Arsenate reductase (Glutaredoxin) n=1 Tax=Aureispira anguillae TaxID=2864201 RepID=A0A915YE52_9BACT|nr:arsenate reductase (glutaredoxin) [Aureispira anguillae]BDS11358.1 arsenate reductase (glutaredoxin) [Aureispira anguillae]
MQSVKTKIYHNPRCSKSRESFNFLTDAGLDFSTVEYLKTPINKAELEDILKKLGIKASQLVRKSEAIYKELYKDKTLQEKEWIDAMLTHPKLIQRPIIVHGDKAVIGRPIEQVIELLQTK